MITIRLTLDILKQTLYWCMVPLVVIFSLVLVPQTIFLLIACCVVGIVVCLIMLPLLVYASWSELVLSTNHYRNVRKKQMPYYRLFRDVIKQIDAESVVDFSGAQCIHEIAAGPAHPTMFYLKSSTQGRRHLVIPLPVLDANLVIYETRVAPDCDTDEGTVLVAVGPEGLRNVNHPFAFVRTKIEKVIADWKENKDVESIDMIDQVFGNILQNVLDKKDPFDGL